MKIPFERTIAGAYRFTFTNILWIIGIGWFPFALFGALITGLVFLWLPYLKEFFSLIGQQQPKPQFDAAKLLPLIGLGFGTYILFILGWIIAQSMVSVGILRKALGQHPGPVFFFFSLGSQVWRLIGSYALIMLMALGTMAVLGGAIAAISAGLSQVSQAWQAVATTILIIAGGLWAIYALMRVTFFIPAVVVAENHIGIRRAWHLGKGNFWRIVGIVLIVTVPLAMAVQTLTSSLLQVAIGPQFGGMPGTTPVESQKIFMEMLHTFSKIWPYYLGLQVISLILQSGLTAGASATAYSLVTGGSDIAPSPTKVPA